MKNSEVKKLDDYYKIAQEFIESREGQLITGRMAGTSMSPTIIPGDEVVFDNSKNKNFIPGDIIVFNGKSCIICHRIKEIIDVDGQPHYIAKGDAPGAAPHELISERIVGKVIFIIREKIRLNPYNTFKKNHFRLLLSRLIKGIRNGFYYGYSFLSKLAKKALTLLKIYPAFKKIVYGLVQYKIEYFLMLPRQTGDSHVYKYVYIPREAIVNKNCGFFEPLQTIGRFKLVANLGNIRLMEIELARYIHDIDEEGEWAVTYYHSKGLSSGGEVERALFNLCDTILSSIGVREILFLNANGKRRSIHKASH